MYVCVLPCELQGAVCRADAVSVRIPPRPLRSGAGRSGSTRRARTAARADRQARNGRQEAALQGSVVDSPHQTSVARARL